MRPAKSVREDTRAVDALEVMLDNSVPGLPVVNERGYLVGFVDDGHLLASTLPRFVTFVNNLPRSREGADRWASDLGSSSPRQALAQAVQLCAQSKQASMHSTSAEASSAAELGLVWMETLMAC
jgi:hypothetical protein